MTTPDVSAELEAATQRVRELGEQVAEQARKNGLAWLEGYETVLKNMLDLEEQAAKGTGAEWATTLASHARQLRPLDVRGRPRRPASAAEGRRRVLRRHPTTTAPVRMHRGRSVYVE
jgi:hypothetical protein